jgi:hypothetical protein
MRASVIRSAVTSGFALEREMSKIQVMKQEAGKLWHGIDEKLTTVLRKRSTVGVTRCSLRAWIHDRYTADT